MASNEDSNMEVDPAIEGDDAEIMAAKIINEEYKIWKKNAIYLYDTFFSRVLDWPTLTTQWFPDKKVSSEENLATHRLLIGTQTSADAPNFLQIAHFQMPINVERDPIDYNPESGEIGGHGATKRSPPKFHIVQQIPHDGDVNKARYMPQNYELIATITSDGKVAMFDRTKHPSQPTGAPNPQIELVGHTGEGYALNWNPNKEGELVTGTNDNTVKLWDVQGFSKASKKLQATRTYTHHTAVVNDAEFHPTLKWMIATVSDDLSLQILDTRTAGTKKAAKEVQEAHTDAINAVAFNHASEYIIATGSADKSIALWDLRMLKVKLHAIEGHKDVVTKIEWCPQEKQVIGSASADRRINFWDLNNVGKEQTPDDAEDGPSELMFMHGGHTNRISDFSFNKNDPYLMLSAAEDNLVHVWTPNDACLHGTDTADVPLEELEA